MNNKGKSTNTSLFSPDFQLVWQTAHKADQLNCYLTEGIAGIIWMSFLFFVSFYNCFLELVLLFYFNSNNLHPILQ